MTLAILCPGQGGQHPAMLDLVADRPEAQPVLAAAADVLGATPQHLLAGGADIYRNRIAQPLVCAATLARWEALRERLPRPGVVLGYSVGELAAHAIAGSFDADTCLRLAARRAGLMDAASPAGAGLLAVVGLDAARIGALCQRAGLTVAIANGEDHFVLGGPGAGLDAAAHEAVALGARPVRIPVCVPAHTPLLVEAARGFEAELRAAALRAPQLPVLAGIDGHRVHGVEDAIATLAAQIARTIEWRGCMRQALERGARVFLELGPGSALTRIARELHPDCAARALDEFRSLDGVLAWVERAFE